MKMRGDPGVDSGEALAAIDDGAANVRVGFCDGSNWAAEHGERKVCLLKWSEKGAVAEFLLDVDIHVLPGEVGGGEVGCSMARIRWGQERDVPAKCEVPEDLWAVEVGPQVGLPFLKIEGVVGEGNLKAVHVCRMTGDGESSADPLDVELLGRGA